MNHSMYCIPPDEVGARGSCVCDGKGDQPQKGDIWEDLSPGYHRYVRVVRVGIAGVFIERVELVDGKWKLPRRAPTRETALTRFNGKAGGFRLHHRDTI
jgi:hypothetical protein